MNVLAFVFRTGSSLQWVDLSNIYGEDTNLSNEEGHMYFHKHFLVSLLQLSEL